MDVIRPTPSLVSKWKSRALSLRLRRKNREVNHSSPSKPSFRMHGVTTPLVDVSPWRVPRENMTLILTLPRFTHQYDFLMNTSTRSIASSGILFHVALVLTRATWNKIPEDVNPRSHRRENLKSYISTRRFLAPCRMCCNDSIPAVKVLSVKLHCINFFINRL
jgi:hypothetical protein